MTFILPSLLLAIHLGNGKTSLEMKQKDNVVEFIDNYSEYKMNIQAAGIANIPEVSLSEKGELYIEYTYQSGSENRHGKMTLQDKMNNRFEGNWKTEADNGNVYQGTLYFVFKEDGQAAGYYKYAGSDYKITIFMN